MRPTRWGTWPPVPSALRWRFRLTAALFSIAAVVFALVVGHSFDPRAGGLWLLTAFPALGYQLWFLRQWLDRAGPSDTAGEPPPEGPSGSSGTLGVATGVTLGRGWLYAGVAGFLFVVPPTGSVWRWVPVAWYGAGAALDWVDGVFAKTVGRRSELGSKLDMAFDTVGFLVAPLVGVAWGRLPVWYLSISAARYLFKAGRGWRRARGRPVYGLPPSRVRRPLAGLQMAFITAALLPIVPVSVVYPTAAVVVAPSLLVFVRDFLVVTGRLRTASSPAGDRSEPTPER
jgi:CDP-diacylglycerol--glycerol-3-phosphate 3-phosphatidyltransferase